MLKFFSVHDPVLTLVLPKGLVVKVICLTCLLQNVFSCLGQTEAFLNITRRDDGDIFTQAILNTSITNCEGWSAEDVSSFSKEKCTVRCKCGRTNKTYHPKMKGCFSNEDILNFENCSGPFLPRFGQPLCDLSRQAQMKLKFPYNQSYCNVSEISYFNGTNDIHFTGKSTGFNISEVVNGSALLTWSPQGSSVLPKLRFGRLLKVRLLCSGMTSRQYLSSCLIIKTLGEVIKKIDLTPSERRRFHGNCLHKRAKQATNVMLVYIVVGSGCGLILVAVLIACIACYSRRRRQPTRQTIPRLSTHSSAPGARKAFKTRSVTKNNEPTTPAIHDIIFNELSWDGDGGFSNRALADPRISDDYGIPVDFGSLPRPNSSVSIDSNRNSLSALTGGGEYGQRRT